METQIPMKKGIFRASRKLRTIVKDNDIDLLISCGAIVGPLGVFGTLFNNTSLIYWSHSSFRGTSKKQFRLFNEHFTAVFAKCIVSLTKTDEINYKKHTAAKKVIQIYNPIDSRLENTHFSYNSESKKIISVGRLTYQKNFEALVDVAEIVLKHNSGYTWDIYGSGEDEEKLKKKIEEKKLVGKLNLKGQSDKLYELYNDYCLMVMTSRYEGFPMSLIEGLACNLPLISFDIPTGPNEIIKNEQNGYLIEPFKVTEMAEKILQLLANSELRIHFSNNSNMYIDQFNIDFILSKWYKLLNEF